MSNNLDVLIKNHLLDHQVVGLLCYDHITKISVARQAATKESKNFYTLNKFNAIEW